MYIKKIGWAKNSREKDIIKDKGKRNKEKTTNNFYYESIDLGDS